VLFSQFVGEAKYEIECTQLLEKVCGMKYCVCKKHAAFV